MQVQETNDLLQVLTPPVQLVHYQRSGCEHYDVFQVGEKIPKLSEDAQQRVKKELYNSELV